MAVFCRSSWLMMPFRLSAIRRFSQCVWNYSGDHIALQRQRSVQTRGAVVFELLSALAWDQVTTIGRFWVTAEAALRNARSAW